MAMDFNRYIALRRLLLAAASPPRSVDLMEAAEVCGITVLETNDPEGILVTFRDGQDPILTIAPNTSRLAFALALAAAALCPGSRVGIRDKAVIKDPEVCTLALDLLLPPNALAAIPESERSIENLAKRFRLSPPLVHLCLHRGHGPCPV